MNIDDGYTNSAVLYGLFQLLRRVKHSTHPHLRDMLVEYLAGLCFDNSIGLESNE